ncbi:TPA: phage integrase Arm DNA-binding domain-containing protein [Escherichia coli]
MAARPRSHKISIPNLYCKLDKRTGGNDSNLLIVFYVQIMPDDFVMQLHRF